MTIESDIQDDFDDLMDEDFAKEVTFGAETIRCFKTMLSTEEIVATAGYQKRYKGSLMTLLSDWGTLPVEDKRVTLEGEKLLVIGTKGSALDVYYRIDYTEKYG